jgi:S-ribosylhomocysteine lyase LuxS involved in autoinducer biosynthesis
LNAYGLQVGIEATARAIVGVRDIIAELRAFAADFASFSHDYQIPPSLIKACTTYQSVKLEKAKRIQNENL